MFPTAIRCLWEISIRFPLTETSQRSLKVFFCDVFKTSEIHLKKKCFSCDVFKITENLKKDIYSVTSQKYFLKVFVTFQKYPTKLVSCDIRRVIELSDKIDVGLSKTLKKWNVYLLIISVVWPTNHLAVLECQKLSNFSNSRFIYCTCFSDFSKWKNFITGCFNRKYGSLVEV